MNRRQPTSKRQSALKEKRRQQTRSKNNRLLVIGGVVVLAVAVVIGLVLLSPKPQQTVASGEIATVPTETWPMSNGKSIGPADAKVVVTEFADFQCPICKEFHDQITHKIIDDYASTGKIRFEYHHFIVIDGNVGGTESKRAAEAADCAADQNKFWDYSNILFANQKGEGSGQFVDARLKAYAEKIGLDTAKFNSCFDSNKYEGQVNVDNAKAVSLGLNGTPSLLINNKLIQNTLDYASIQAQIEAALKAAGQ